MEAKIVLNPKLLMERVVKAINDHDPVTIQDCLSPYYLSEQPVHPDRSFRGRERAAEEWAEAFRRVPNLRAEMLRYAIHEDTAWVEWHMYGTRTDKKRIDLWGVGICGIKDDKMTWSHVYLEPVQEPGQGIVSLTG